MLKILGVEISQRAIILSLVHTAIETVTMVLWLALAMEANGIAMKLSTPGIIAVVVLFVGLALEHIVALSPGKVA